MWADIGETILSATPRLNSSSRADGLSRDKLRFQKRSKLLSSVRNHSSSSLISVAHQSTQRFCALPRLHLLQDCLAGSLRHDQLRIDDEIPQFIWHLRQGDRRSLTFLLHDFSSRTYPLA